MKKHLWDDLIKVLKEDVVPALGCTEPVSVALAASIARKKLNNDPINIQVYVSPNLMKNGMGVGIPGTGMVGLPIATALGVIAGDSDAGLEVLKNITTQDVTKAKQLVDSKAIRVNIANVTNILYAKVTLSNSSESVSVTIADNHTQVVSIEENGITTFANWPQYSSSTQMTSRDALKTVQVKDIYDFAVNSPLENLLFIHEAKKLNSELSDEGLKGSYGLQIGATFARNVKRGILSGGLLTDVLIRTSAASDARMDGAMKPAMSNSGSGNQGITVTMPVVATAEYLNISGEKEIRALILAHLMAIYIKNQQNKLSALCGATTAAMGAAAGITYLLNGTYQQISQAITSMIGDIAGIICDGAKTSCAMKVSSSASSAVKASLMAIDNLCVTGYEGIVTDNVDSSILNLSSLANGSMTKTDAQILDIMLSKSA